MWKVLSQAIHMCNMKAPSLLVRKLWPRLNYFKSRSKFKVKNYGTMWKVLSQAIHICNIMNMKALSLLVRKLWPRLKFFKSKSKFKVKVTRSKNYGSMWKVLSQAIHMCNMKALSLLIRKLWQRLKFFKSRSKFKVKVKVTRSKNYGSKWKVLSQGIHMCNMKALSLPVIKLWPRSKFLFTHTRRRRSGHQGYDISSPDIRPGSLISTCNI